MRAEKKWLLKLFTAAFLSLILLLFSSFSVFNSPKTFQTLVQHCSHNPPSFAYFISGGDKDKDRILRLLLAIYHPRNRYLLHLGKDARDEDRQALATAVRSVPAIRAFGNVDVVGKADWVTYLGSSNVAITLRAAAIMLKLDNCWNWFITLSARDYPLITQDDLSHVFSSVGRDLNFIDHTSDLGWKEGDRFRPIVVDPGLYLARRSQIFQATQKRPIPDAFKLFTGKSFPLLLSVQHNLCLRGSPWVVLSRPFLEFCILGWDNLPRILLMYFTNIKLPQEGYFHSVICNAPEFKNTTVNGHLRYMIWDNPPKMEPLFLNSSVYDQMAGSGAAFARQFEDDNHVLDMIDDKILRRGRNRATPGAWCTGRWSLWMDPCSRWGDVNIVKAGPQAKKLEGSISILVDDLKSQTNQCQ
ncbi:putative glucuronosyltransferase [Lupinus albus]|uniref:Putative glucuronosyltransferase n=1 Tax=Lupinus albus TaxID=3870 RepID=A0A6A4QX42_LUPAL|nr:putative glucuronosyltransferase [Lupinus albus]